MHCLDLNNSLTWHLYYIKHSLVDLTCQWYYQRYKVHTCMCQWYFQRFIEHLMVLSDRKTNWLTWHLNMSMILSELYHSLTYQRGKQFTLLTLEHVNGDVVRDLKHLLDIWTYQLYYRIEKLIYSLDTWTCQWCCQIHHQCRAFLPCTWVDQHEAHECLVKLS